MSGLLAGVDLGGTKISAAVAAESGEILAEDTVATESQLGPAGVVDRLHGLLTRLTAETGRSLAAIGVGVPGLVDIATGTTRFLPNLPTQWRDVPLGRWLQERFHCPVAILNDARAATLAELRFGHGRVRPRITFAFFTLGTGVGGGVVIDGKLRLGPLGAAGEIGHQTLLPEGPRCGCGNRGCLETLASGPALTAAGIRLLRSGLAPRLFELVAGKVERVMPRELLAAAEAGDELVREVLLTAAQWIGIAAANVVAVLHPELIVLGGGVAELGPILTDEVQRVIRDRVRMYPIDDLRVVPSQLRDRAGVLGAVALAADALRVDRP